MKAKDLRIGNWLHFDNLLGWSYDYQLTPRHMMQLGLSNPNDIEVELNNYHHPILLTEEWLEKMGFTIDRGLVFYPMVARKEPITIPFDKGDWKYWSGKLCITIQHVHQLQNLFYVLTGQELNINQLKDGIT